MRIGMPTLTEFTSIEEQIQLCHELGLNLLEINLNYPYCDLENNHLETIRQLSQTYQVALSLHYDEFADFASFHDEIRQAWIQHFKKTIRLAKKLDVIRITIHLFEGVHVTLPKQKVYVNEVYYQKYIALLMSSLKECRDYADLYQIDFCIENVAMPPFMIKTFKELFEEGFHFTYDVGHHYEFGLKAQPLYEKNWPLVKHMHLHDGINTAVHKALGSGTIDIEKMLNTAYKNMMDVIIEVKDLSALKTSCLYLEKLNKKRLD